MKTYKPTILDDYGFTNPLDKEERFAIKINNKSLGGLNKMTDKPNLEGFKKVEAKIAKFEKDGDFIIGELIAVRDSNTFSNKNYSLKCADGDFTVFGTTVLDNQMEKAKIGDILIIILESSKPNKNPVLNDIKMFEVHIKQ